MNFKKIFCTLSGDDYSIISKCSKNLQLRFVAIGAFVLFIFSICFTSSYFAFTKLFQNKILGIPSAVFFAWMITNIYLLLLYTLTKNVLPIVKNQRAKIFSTGIRLTFICFIALIIAKPLEAYIYSDSLKREVALYKQAQIYKYGKLTNQYFQSETQHLDLIINHLKKNESPGSKQELEFYEKLYLDKKYQRSESIHQMELLVTYSDYYVYSILVLMKKYPISWLYSCLSIIIFLLPAYLKKFLKEQSNFYNIKKRVEEKIILDEYTAFKIKYAEIFNNRYNKAVKFSECYIDPPFNTVRREEKRHFFKEDDLISELYDC